MISMLAPVFSAISAAAFRRLSNHPQKRNWLGALCVVLAVLLCGAGSIASAQTAHFSGSVPSSWIQSSLPFSVSSSGGNNIAVDKGGNVYLANSSGPYVFKFTPSLNGYAVSTIGSGLTAVLGVAVDGSGNVYIADGGSLQVVKETPSGSSYIQSVVAPFPAGGLTFVTGLAVDGSGNVYLAVSSSGQILKETPSGSGYAQSTVVTGQYGISSIAADSSGNLYFTDSIDHAAVKETLVSGNYYPSLVGNTGGYCIPNAVAVDSNGNVFIVGHNTVLVGGNITYSGAAFVETPQGNSYVQSTIDISGTIPGGLGVDGSGNVYIVGSGQSEMETPVYGNFGAVSVGSTSSQQISLSFTFDTAGTLGSVAVLTQGATGLDFAKAGTGSCTANKAYTAGQSCTVNVTFTPKFAGSRYGAAVLYNSTGSVIATGYVHGSGVGPQVNFLPGTETTVASASNGLSFPYGIAVDGGGNLYIADSAHNRILKETFSGGSYTQSTIPTSTLYFPWDIAVDGGGNVYIADTNNYRVLKESPTPRGYSESIVVPRNGNQIVGVAVDGSGNVYFASFWGTVYKETLSAGGYIQSAIPTSSSEIGKIAVDGDGDIFVADDANSQILMEKPSQGGYIESTIPTSGLDTPAGIAVDASGSLFILDVVNNRVLKETLSAGSYTQSTVPTSQLSMPYGLAVDGRGSIYISDAGNLRVLREDLSTPPILSFASTAEGSASSDSPQTITVENAGNAALTFPIPSTGYNPSIATNFSLNDNGASACPVIGAGFSQPGTLAAGAFCQLSISFAPAATGTLNGSLVLMDNNLNAAAPGYTTQSITLSGTGTQATPPITWATPASITYGTPLSGTQLDATSTVAGTFTYSPAAGTVLTAGAHTLSVTFAPTDTTDYTEASATVTLTVNQAIPTITWATPAAITYGTALSATQLNASSTVAGSFAYSPVAGTVLAAGAQTLTVTFTPTDATDYTTATATVTLTVNQATPPITWATPAAITYGTPLSATQLNASSPVAGTFTYSSAAGAVLGAGQQTLTATFTPTDTTDFTAETASVTLTVNKATPTITWATPAAITYGTALSAMQLNASSTVAGSFAYSPAAGTVLNAGAQTLTATFTPTDATDYTTATTTVTLIVNKATPTITWATPVAITYGTALSGTQLNANASVPGAFVYSPAAGTVLAVGTDTLTVIFTPTDATDYTTATGSVQLKVNPAPSFTLGASPASLTVARGASGKSTITVTGQNGFTGSVTLAASGLPSGVTAAFATNPTTGSSVLTLTASSTAAVGSATITIKGISGSLTASTTVALTISCTPTTIVPYISINGGSTWTQESSATVSSRSTVVDLGPQPTSGGSWSWTGPSGYKSTSRQINSIPLTVGTDSFVATYTNASGCKSSETFTITVK
jgi:hypothetical protein